MALPSNVPRGVGGLSLKIFSRSPAPGSAGEDVFAQKCPRDEELYVFPPFVMIGSLIGLFQEWGNVTVTMVVPRHPHPKSWWPYLCSFVQKPVRLAEMGQFGILEYPTANGYAPNEKGLPFELWAFKCFFPRRDVCRAEIVSPIPKRVLLLSDSMFKGLKGAVWPASWDVQLNINGGQKMASVCRKAAVVCRRRRPEAVVLHGGINDFSGRQDCAADVQKIITAFRVAARRLKAQFPCCTFIGSSVCQTKLTRINPHVAEVNLALRATCADCGWLFLSNDYIMQGDLMDDVHLSVWGNLKLHRRLRVFLASALGLRLGPNVSGLE